MADARQSTSDLKGDHLSAHMFGAMGDATANDTSALLSTFIPLGGDGSNVERLIPTGTYLVIPGELSIPNPQSGYWRGHGSRFNTIIKSSNAASVLPVVSLGDGTFEPHSFVIEHLSIDVADGIGVGLFLNRTNLMVFRDVIIQGLGLGAIGVDTTTPAILFGEMIFDHCGFLGKDSGGVAPAGSIGLRLYSTGNVELHSCNIEKVETGIILIGAQQSKFVFIGGHLERLSLYAFVLSNCQPLIDCEPHGAVWLDNDVINGTLNLSNTSGQWTDGAVVDNGFGNRIRKTASKLFMPGSKATYATGVAFDGTEWMAVAGINSDPTFLGGTTGWVGTNATVAMSTISMPGVASGKSMAIKATAANGYAEKTFTASANTDYLLQVGILTDPVSTYRILVANSGGTVWDSGNFSYLDASLYASDFQSFKVIRKRIPVVADTVFKVRIYAVTSGLKTVCSLLLISTSEIQMASDYATSGSGFSSAGSGAGIAYTQDTTTGKIYSVKGSTLTERCFFRAVVTVPVGVSGALGVGGDGNDPTAGPIVPLRSGVKVQYILPLSSFPVNSTVVLYSFTGGGAITIEEIGLYAIQNLQNAPYVVQTPTISLINSLPLSAGKLSIGAGSSEVFWQAVPSAANSFTRVIYASNLKWDEAAALWRAPNNGGSDYAAMILLNSGIIAFVCEVGLTLPVTRTHAQLLAAIKFQIDPSEPLWTFINGTKQFLVHVGNGSPLGVVNASSGDLYADVSSGAGALWVSPIGGNAGWLQLATSVSDPNNTTLNVIAGSSFLAFTTSYVDIPGATLTLNKTGTWLIIATCPMNCDSTEGFSSLVQLLAGGAAQTGVITVNPIGASTGINTPNPTRQWVYAGTDGDIVKLHGKKLGGAGVSGTANNVALTAVFLHT